MNQNPTALSQTLLSTLRGMILLGMCSWFGGTATAADDEAEPVGESAEMAAANIPFSSWVTPHYSARLRLEYDYRKAGSDSDNDVYGRFYGSGQDLSQGRFDFYVSARLKSDLDKPVTASYAEDPFISVDELDGVTENRLLQAYADVHDREKRITLRGGRQYIEISDYLQMDGLQLGILEHESFGGRVYVGQPVSYYTSVSDDYAVGLSLVGRPWEGNQSRFTFARYHDESEDGADQNYFLDLRQQFLETQRIRGQLSVLNEEFRMGRADYYYFSPDGETDLSLGMSYWGSYDAKTRVYSPLYRVLGSAEPYGQLYARLTQQIAPSWLLSPGVSIRAADSEGTAEYANRDFENYDITLIFDPNRTFNASLSLEYWEVDNNDNFFGLSGDLRYRYARIWEISGGASFSEYTYDTYSDISYASVGGQTVFAEEGTIIQQSPYVYTYFLRGKWNITSWLKGRLNFSIEDNEEFSDLAYRTRASLEVRY